MSTGNPYEAPRATPGDATHQRRPLFSPGAITAHTFLFTPIAGIAMAALNYVRAGEPARARRTLLTYGIPTVLFLIVALALSERSASAVRLFGFALTAGCANLLAREQQPVFEAHRRAGGQTARWYWATLVALGTAVTLVFAAGVLVTLLGVA